MGATAERYLSLQEVGGEIGVSGQTVRRWVKAGELAAYKPGKEYRIKGSDLEEFLKTREVSPKVQSPLPEADEARRDAETAEKLLRFGERMVAQWESELPDRLEAEDEEWLGHTWAMYHEFIAILNSVRPGESSNKQELLGSLMDINAAAQRIVTMVHQHNERALEAGKKVLVLQETT